MASIFAAESRGKDKDEDILTSRVFGVLNIADKSLVLGKLLEKIGIKMPKNEVENAQVRLWEKHGECIPDAVIETKSSLVFVESKLGSPLSLEQLRTEYKQGSKESDSFYLLCISKHFDFPEEIENLKKELQTDRLFWTSWQSLYTHLLPFEKSVDLDKTSKALIKDLRSLFEAERLRGFSGFENTQYENITNAYDSFAGFYNELSIFIQELDSQLKRRGIELKRTTQTSFHRDGRGTRLDSPEEWVTSFVSFAFGRKAWPFERFWRDNYIFVRFRLDEPKLYVGYRLRPDQPSHKKLLINRKDKLLEYLKGIEDAYVLLDQRDEVLGDEDLSGDLFKPEELQRHWEFALAYHVPIDRIDDRKLLTLVRKRIVYLDELVSKLDLIPQKVQEEVDEEGEEEENEGED